MTERTTSQKQGTSVNQSPYQYGRVLHGVGVGLSLVALGFFGLDSPSVGLPVAVGALIGFGMLSSPPVSAPPAVLDVVRGGVLQGGMKQGAVIKALFAIALLYAGSRPALVGDGELLLPRLLLGSALGVSAVGTALEARWLGRLAEKKWNGQ